MDLLCIFSPLKHVLFDGLHSPWGSLGQRTGVGSPGDLLNPGIEPRSSILQADSLPAEPPGKPEIIFKVALKLVIDIWNQK